MGREVKCHSLDSPEGSVEGRWGEEGCIEGIYAGNLGKRIEIWGI